MSAKFDFNDFLKQWQNMNNMGGMSMMKLLPGFNKVGMGEEGWEHESGNLEGPTMSFLTLLLF